jgi:hypothetical protein
LSNVLLISFLSVFLYLSNLLILSSFSLLLSLPFLLLDSPVLQILIAAIDSNVCFNC